MSGEQVMLCDLPEEFPTRQATTAWPTTSTRSSPASPCCPAWRAVLRVRRRCGEPVRLGLPFFFGRTVHVLFDGKELGGITGVRRSASEVRPPVGMGRMSLGPSSALCWNATSISFRDHSLMGVRGEHAASLRWKRVEQRRPTPAVSPARHQLDRIPADRGGRIRGNGPGPHQRRAVLRRGLLQAAIPCPQLLGEQQFDRSVRAARDHTGAAGRNECRPSPQPAQSRVGPVTGGWCSPPKWSTTGASSNQQRQQFLRIPSSEQSRVLGGTIQYHTPIQCSMGRGAPGPVRDNGTAML